MQIVVIQTTPELIVEVAFMEEETTHPLLETALAEVVSKAEVMVKEATILQDSKVITENSIDVKQKLTPPETKPPNRLILTQPITDPHQSMRELGVFVDTIREKYIGDVIREVKSVDSKTGKVVYKPKDLSKCPQFVLAPIIKAEEVIEGPIIEPVEPVIDEEKIIEDMEFVVKR